MTARQSLLAASCACLAACARPEPPPAHIAVSATVEHFAPGLAIGQPLRQSGTFVRGRRWVQHAGMVGRSPRAMFVQARVYPDVSARAAAQIDSGALVQAVELVSDGRSDRVAVMSDLAIAFRGVPKQGCLGPLEPGGPHRGVTYWTAPNDAGGAAVLEEWGDTAIASDQRLIWSLFVWGGPFRGTETFFAPFTPGFCERSMEPETPAALQRTLAAIEDIQQAFTDSVRGVSRAVAAAKEYEMSNENPLDACMAGVASGPTKDWDLDGAFVELPADLEEDEGYSAAERRAARNYGWRAPDGTRVTIRAGPDTLFEHGTGGSLVSHCTEPNRGRARDIDLFNLSHGSPDLRVNATFPARGTGLSFEGIARSRERQEQLLRAAHSIRISGRWGERTATLR